MLHTHADFMQNNYVDDWIPGTYTVWSTSSQAAILIGRDVAEKALTLKVMFLTRKP